MKGKDLLSAVSPLYAATQGKLPGGLGLGIDALNRVQDKKRREKEKAKEAEMMGAKEADASAATKAATMPMSMGGETSKRRPIDGAAIRGLTKGRII